MQCILGDRSILGFERIFETNYEYGNIHYEK